MRLVFLGDSLTEGRDGASYLDRVHTRMAADPRMASFEIVNAGAGGDTVVNLLDRFARDVVHYQPHWVVIFIGVNDATTALLWRRWPTPAVLRSLWYFRTLKHLSAAVTPPRFEAGLRKLVSQVETQTRARVALCTPAAFGEDLAAAEWQLLSAYATVVRRLAAERGCPLIDLHAAFARALLGLRPRRYRHGEIDGATLRAAGGDYDLVARRHGYRLVYDGIHLSMRGAELVADEVYRWMREV